MGFKKGKSGNPNGRPQGSENKSTGVIRKAFNDFVENNLEQIQSYYKAMNNPKDRLYFIINLAEYCIPKLQRTELTGEGGKPIEMQIYKLPDGTEIKF